MKPGQIVQFAAAAALVAALLAGCGDEPAEGQQPTHERIERARQALKSRDPTARALAATVLGKIGPEAREAVPDLERLLKDRDPKVRDAARTAIDQIQNQGD